MTNIEIRDSKAVVSNRVVANNLNKKTFSCYKRFGKYIRRDKSKFGFI